MSKKKDKHYIASKTSNKKTANTRAESETFEVEGLNVNTTYIR